MKILCVIDSLSSGGAQRQLVELAIGLKEKGHGVSFLVYHNINFFKSILDEANIPVNLIIESNYLKRLIKFRIYILKGNFDGLLSFLEAPNFICEIAGFPSHKWWLIVGERSANPNIQKCSKLRLFRWFHLLADHIVANTQQNINMVRGINPLLKSRKCHVIYNVIDTKKWHPDNTYFPRRHSKFQLIIIARHQYRKNLNGLVEAVNLLSKEEKQKISIDWYGADDMDNSKDSAIGKILKFGISEVFNFYEPTLDIGTKIQNADALGLFSFFEGLPNSICEGMACGKPILSTDVSDISLFIKDGVNGFIIKENNPESIRDGIVTLLNCSDEYLIKLGKNSEKKARILFNKNIVINKYLELMHSAT
jgi:glycosyltransferase involved in cell wall biosynthesis